MTAARKKNTRPLGPGALVLAYIRDSGGTEQEMSAAQQEATIRTYCREHSYTLTRIFTDSRSGGSTTGRTGFESMIEYIRTGATESAVIIWKMSRFARDLTDAQYYKADLRRRGLHVISIQDNLPAGPEATLVENILDWSNARYLADLSSDIKRGKNHIIQTYHVWPGGTIPYGYIGVPVVIGAHRDGSPRTAKRLEPDPITGPLVRQAFELRASGATYAEIHAKLHLFDWTSSYQALFRRKLYLGIYDYNGLHIENFCQPLIDQATYDAAQRINKARTKAQRYDHPRAVHSRFWLTGLLICQCGGNIVAQSYTTKSDQGKRYSYDYYACSRRISKVSASACTLGWIRKETLEKRIISTLEQIIQPAILEDLLNEATTQQTQTATRSSAERLKIQADLDAINASLARIEAAIIAAGHSETLLASLARLETQRSSLRIKLTETNTPAAPEMPSIDPASFIPSALQALNHGQASDRAAVARGLIQRIHIHSSTPLAGEVIYAIPGSSERSICL